MCAALQLSKSHDGDHKDCHRKSAVARAMKVKISIHFHNANAICCDGSVTGCFENMQQSLPPLVN
jgi:hypothetical protein